MPAVIQSDNGPEFTSRVMDQWAYGRGVRLQLIEPGKPIVLELEPGTYYRCTCGGSKKQPFCDGSCKESDCSPVQFEIKEKQQVYLCNCGKTNNGPFCDGSCSK